MCTNKYDTYLQWGSDRIFFGRYLRNKLSSQFNSWRLQTIPSIFRLPLIPQNNAEATLEVSLPLQGSSSFKDIPLLVKVSWWWRNEESHLTGCELSISVIIGFTWKFPALLPATSAFFATLQRVVLPVENRISILREANRERPVHPTRVQHVGYKMLTDVLWFVPSAWDGFYTSHYENKENEIFLREVKATHQFGKWQSRYRDPISGSKAHTFFSLLICVWPEWLASRACSPIANVKHAGPQSTHLGNTQGSLTCWR